MEDLIVVGGGAAGFFAAIACAQEKPGLRILILERGTSVLAKVVVSGGGRCNVTHACFDPKKLITYYPRGGKALMGPFSRFQPRDTVNWFESRGIPLKTEEDGRIFPQSDNSRTITAALEMAAARLGVRVKTAMEIKKLAPAAEGFTLEAGGSTFTTRRLLLASGSGQQGHVWAREMGHRIIPPVPSLFSFHVPNDPRLKGLAGISVRQARVSWPEKKLSQEGPLLVTHAGISGPAVLKLSSWGARFFADAGYRTEIKVAWIPEQRPAVEAALRALQMERARQRVAGHPAFDLPLRLWERLVAAAGVVEEGKWADLSAVARGKLAGELTEGSYRMSGKSPFKEEFVTCGGVDLDDVDFRTMESRKRPGLYFAGEILDVDALTGGFNFQNAWTTGWVAGRSIAQAFK